MATPTVFDAMTARFRAKLKTRLLAFGSSNTERFLPGMHWFDVLDLSLQHAHGRIHQCVNTGIGGHTSRDLLDRFEDDAAFYRPHLALITIGGNDSNPDKHLTAKEFEANLKELRRRFGTMGCAVVFQTYYAPDPARVEDKTRLANFYTYMDIVRSVAAETESGLVDHLSRWEAFRKVHPARYLPLMQDGFHLNWHGNMVMGLDLARAFGVSCVAQDPDYWREGVELQSLMDSVAPDR